MNQLAAQEKLSEEEFFALHSKYKESGDITVRNRLVMAYGYIAKIAALQLRGSASSQAQVEDMINHGMIIRSRKGSEVRVVCIYACKRRYYRPDTQAGLDSTQSKGKFKENQ